MRGFQAPPRRMLAPAVFTARAVSRIWSLDSTEQGPAMTVMARPPTCTPSTSMTVSSSFTSRETSLKGCETRRASATPGSMAKSSGSTAPVLPTTATTRRSVPEMGCGVRPSDADLLDDGVEVGLRWRGASWR